MPLVRHIEDLYVTVLCEASRSGECPSIRRFKGMLWVGVFRLHDVGYRIDGHGSGTASRATPYVRIPWPTADRSTS